MLQGSHLSSNWRDFPCSLSPLAKFRLGRRTASMSSWKISVLSIRGAGIDWGGSPKKTWEVLKSSIRPDVHIGKLAGFAARFVLGDCTLFVFLSKCYGTVSHVDSVLPVVLDSIAVMSRQWCHRAKVKRHHFNDAKHLQIDKHGQICVEVGNPLGCWLELSAFMSQPDWFKSQTLVISCYFRSLFVIFLNSSCCQYGSQINSTDPIIMINIPYLLLYPKYLSVYS